MTASGTRLDLPPVRPGLRVGLYGGSFDPVHGGHLHVAETAMRALRLDRVWWIVSPSNPLKSRRPADRTERLGRVSAALRHPRMAATDIEGRLGIRYTVETIRTLRRRCPGVRFVWIMGADSLAGFHRWRGWEEIARLVPIAVVDRPGSTLPALRSRAARTFDAARIPLRDAARLPLAEPPAWVFLFGRRSNLSSTALRKADGDRPADVEIGAAVTQTLP